MRLTLRWSLLALSTLALLFGSFVLRLWLFYWAVWLVGAALSIVIWRATRAAGKPARSGWLTAVLSYSCLVVVFYSLFCGRVETETISAYPSLKPAENGRGWQVLFEFSGYVGFHWAVESDEIQEHVEGQTGPIELVVERIADFGCTRSLRVVRCGELDVWTMRSSGFLRNGSGRTYGQNQACWCQ